MSEPRPAARPVASRRRTRHRRAAASAVGVTACLLLSACWSANQDKALDLIASSRAQAAKPALQGDVALMQRAQAWTDHLAATNTLEHTGGGSEVSTEGIANWCSVGENIARASSTHAAHAALMADPPHRKNVLGSFDRVGTGVTRKGDRVWVVQIFVRSC